MSGRDLTPSTAPTDPRVRRGPAARGDPPASRGGAPVAAEGLPNSEIAATLHLAEGTVRNYLSTAITKLGVRNRIEAARVAHDRGWL